jgi:integrase
MSAILPEPFVDAVRAATFLSIKPRRLLQLARSGELPAYPIGTGQRRVWVFASHRLKGAQPREGNLMAADYLRPAAVRAGVIKTDYKGRFGWHNFRHSLASHLVTSGTDAKTVQELLRHSKVQTTLDLYAQSIPTERIAAQGRMLEAIFPSPSTSHSIH